MDNTQKQKAKRVIDGLMEAGRLCLVIDYGFSLQQAEDWHLRTLNLFDKELDKWEKEEKVGNG